jgi:hypothetical protein
MNPGKMIRPGFVAQSLSDSSNSWFIRIVRSSSIRLYQLLINHSMLSHSCLGFPERFNEPVKTHLPRFLNQLLSDSLDY